MEVRYEPDDLHVIVLFHENGAEICRAHGEGRWGVLPHDIRMRNMALRNIDKASFERMPQDGPLTALFACLQRDAPTKPSAALKLAHCLAVLGRHFTGETVDPGFVSQLIGSGSILDAATLCELPAISALPAPPPTLLTSGPQMAVAGESQSATWGRPTSHRETRFGVRPDLARPA